jgi:predicted enzyme related to lactoylglutathione lyase
MVRTNVSIDVPDLETGLRFYATVFGWKEVARPFPTMAILDGNNVSVCLHAKPKGSRPTPTDAARDYGRHWTPVHLDFHVDDFDATLERARQAGAVVEMSFTKPKATAFCSDPFGHGFCLIDNH